MLEGLHDAGEIKGEKLILNHEHPLCKLADSIDWDSLDKQLSESYHKDMGRPGNATRLMVGLHYLKHAFDESDESVVARWIENPYWQYFCGYKYMQHEFPIHPTSMTKWRNRVGSKRMEVLLQETINTAKREKHLKPSEISKVIVDTTVQEKAIAFPTDARLCVKAIQRLVKLSHKFGIDLRQSYVRVSKKHFSVRADMPVPISISEPEKRQRSSKPIWAGLLEIFAVRHQILQNLWRLLLTAQNEF